MRRSNLFFIPVVFGLISFLMPPVSALIFTGLPDAWAAVGPHPLLIGKLAFGDFATDAPGVRRKITAADLPPPYQTKSAGNPPPIIERPADATLKVPPGFVVDQFAHGLEKPRLIRVAPNGDIFIAESYANRIRVLRASDGSPHAEQSAVFATGLNLPFGIAFYPPGKDPQYVYIANTDSVVRFPYRSGDMRARTAPQTIVRVIPAGGHLRGGGHWTRDIVFSKDGSHMFVSVGSLTNDAENLAQRSTAEGRRWDQSHGLSGVLWESEYHRADVLEFNPDGSGEKIFATGIRNCVGEAINPITGELWCSTNERDDLGDNLPPDYITSVREGGFYGWPWYYIGPNMDPRHEGQRPDLRDKVIVPDVLLQAHSASLEMTFYQATQFPPAYRGGAFAAEHGSWNRARRTGYKIIYVPMKDGHATGEYDDFLTSFVAPDGDVWGRPVGVAVAHDGSLLITEDAHGTVWRVSYHGGGSPR